MDPRPGDEEDRSQSLASEGGDTDGDVDEERERRLDVIVTEFLTDLHAGKTPSSKAIIAENPDLAADLEEFFASLDDFGGLAVGLPDAPERVPRAIAEDLRGRRRTNSRHDHRTHAAGSGWDDRSSG